MEERDVREFNRSVKELKRMKREKSMGKVLSMFGKVIPKGIKHPDSLVGNRHLYIPGRGGKTILK